MASSKIRVRCKAPGLRGGKIGGCPSGATYYVHPSDSELYVMDKSLTAFAKDPGVHPEDVGEFDGIPREYVRVHAKASPVAGKAPTRLPAPPVAPPPLQTQDESVVAMGSDDEGGPQRSEAELAFPTDADQTTVKALQAFANAYGIVLNKEEQRLTKPKLYELLKARLGSGPVAATDPAPSEE